MKRIVAHVLLLICVVVTVAGCGKDQPPAPAKSAASFATPRQVVETMVQALRAQDRATYLSCFVGTESELVLAEALFDFSKAGSEFRQTMIARHGQRAWEKFQDRHGGGARINLPFAEKDHEAWVSSLSFEEKGDQATCTDPDSGKPLPLVRQQGKWQIKAAGLAPAEAEPDKLAGVMRRSAAVIRKYHEKLQGPDIDLVKLDQEMGRDFLAAMMGTE